MTGIETEMGKGRSACKMLWTSFQGSVQPLIWRKISIRRLLVSWPRALRPVGVESDHNFHSHWGTPVSEQLPTIGRQRGTSMCPWAVPSCPGQHAMRMGLGRSTVHGDKGERKRADWRTVFCLWNFSVSWRAQVHQESDWGRCVQPTGTQPQGMPGIQSDMSVKMEWPEEYEGIRGYYQRSPQL